MLWGVLGQPRRRGRLSGYGATGATRVQGVLHGSGMAIHKFGPRKVGCALNFVDQSYFMGWGGRGAGTPLRLTHAPLPLKLDALLVRPERDSF